MKEQTTVTKPAEVTVTKNTQELAIIACVSKDMGLGRARELLWRIPADMAFFKKTTMGGVVIMGRKTFASLGNPLPGRRNVVLSRSPLDSPGVDWCQSPEALDEFLQTLPEPKFIIGGASLYKMYLPRADKIYLTEVADTQPADTYFPAFDHTNYQRTVLANGTSDGISYEIVEYLRKN